MNRTKDNPFEVMKTVCYFTQILHKWLRKLCPMTYTIGASDTSNMCFDVFLGYYVVPTIVAFRYTTKIKIKDYSFTSLALHKHKF